MQRSHTSLGTDLAAIARGCSFRNVMDICDMEQIDALARTVNTRSGCALAKVRVRADDLPRALPPRDGVYVKNRMRAALAFAPF
jgi:hypothetical protein